MRRHISMAVVGCGYWGSNLIRSFCALRNQCSITLACDCDEERLRWANQSYPSIGTTTHFEQIINDDRIDAVVIATPASWHYTLAKQALRAHKHVLVEKPMATTAQQCRELCSLARSLHLVLMVGHTFIYSPEVEYLGTLLKSGCLGKLYSVNSRRMNYGRFQKDVNAAWDLAPHDISIILHLLKEQPVGVNCQGASHINGNEEFTVMTLRFPSGVYACIQSSWLNPVKVREMVLVGSEKMAVYDTEQAEKIRVFNRHITESLGGSSRHPIEYQVNIDSSWRGVHGVEPLKAQCGHFLDCIPTRRTPITSGVDGLHVVQILEAASASLKHCGDLIRLPTGKSDYCADDHHNRSDFL